LSPGRETTQRACSMQTCACMEPVPSAASGAGKSSVHEG
jgi:hypothetical protein